MAGSRVMAIHHITPTPKFQTLLKLHKQSLLFNLRLLPPPLFTVPSHRPFLMSAAPTASSSTPLRDPIHRHDELARSQGKMTNQEQRISALEAQLSELGLKVKNSIAAMKLEFDNKISQVLKGIEALAGPSDDYESDPEQAKLSLKMQRRTVASDDEEEDDDGGVDGRNTEKMIASTSAVLNVLTLTVVRFEATYSGNGAPPPHNQNPPPSPPLPPSTFVPRIPRLSISKPSWIVRTEGAAGGEYEDDSYLEEEEELLEEVEEEESGERHRISEVQRLRAPLVAKDLDGGYGSGVSEQEEKKENEPIAVPTSRAFYMHDDRFRDSAGSKFFFPIGEIDSDIIIDEGNENANWDPGILIYIFYSTLRARLILRGRECKD